MIGSSLGGTLAILAAARFAERIDRLVLLAPAVMFAKPGDHMLPPERIEEWRRAGSLRFFHYAYGEERPLDFTFYQDSLDYDAFNAPIVQPTLVFQGMRDASVDYRDVEQFARARAERDAFAPRRRSPADSQPAEDVERHRAVSRTGMNTTYEATEGSRSVRVQADVIWPAKAGRYVVRALILCASVALSFSPGAAQQDRPRTEVRIGVLRPGGGYTVQTFALETYIARVLAGEAARDSRPAALEALAITIRTFVLANPGRHRADGFDLCDQTHCQVMRTPTPAHERAAAATAGQALLRGGVPVEVFYSASCGGRTEIPSAVWPGHEDPATHALAA